MRFLTVLPLVLSLSSCHTMNSPKLSEASSSEKIDPSKTIISTYKDGKVTLKDVNIELEKLITRDDKLRGLTFDNLTADQKKLIVKEVVLKEIASEEAKNRNLNKDQDYKDALSLFKSELLKQKLFIVIAKEASEEKNVKKGYDDLVAKLKNKEDLRIRYIVVKNKNEAEVIYRSLAKSPQSFASQAKQKSLDKEIGKKGGDLGFVMEDVLPEEVSKQAKLLSNGQIGKPIQLSDNWVVIKLESRRPAEITSFENAKDALAQSLAKKAIEDFVSKNLEKAKINFLVK